MNAEKELREKFGDFDVDIDVMRDVYMTHHQRECYNRILARALTRPAPTEAEVEAAAKRMWEVAPNFFAWDLASEAVHNKYFRMARAALGVQS